MKQKGEKRGKKPILQYGNGKSRGESAKRLVAERLSRKKAKIKGRGKFGYVFCESRTHYDVCVCAPLCMNETEIGNGQGYVTLRRVC